MHLVPEEELVAYTKSARIVFQIILWPIVIVGLIGNIGVVVRICAADAKKNSVLKPFYRGSLLSLAFADFLLLVASGTNTLSSIGNETILWKLPSWCCRVLPFLQTIAVVVVSLTLAAVAIDRYAAIKSKFPLSNELNWPCALLFVAGTWALSLAVSYPVLGIYTDESLIVINENTYYAASLCLSNREDATLAYTILFAVIFIPLGGVFLVIHILLVLNIWQRNRPAGSPHQQSNSSASQFSNDNSTVSTNLGKTKHVPAKKVGPIPTHVARKRRTVRVILVLIIVFAICRLPQWTFLVVKLHTKMTGDFTWYIQLVFSSMSLLNAAVHPFLYAFLNEALSLVAWIRAKFTRNVVASKIRPISEQVAGSPISAKIPRGPYYSP